MDETGISDRCHDGFGRSLVEVEDPQDDFERGAQNMSVGPILLLIASLHNTATPNATHAPFPPSAPCLPIPRARKPLPQGLQAVVFVLPKSIDPGGCLNAQPPGTKVFKLIDADATWTSRDRDGRVKLHDRTINGGVVSVQRVGARLLIYPLIGRVIIVPRTAAISAAPPGNFTLEFVQPYRCTPAYLKRRRPDYVVP